MRLRKNWVLAGAGYGLLVGVTASCGMAAVRDLPAPPPARQPCPGVRVVVPDGEQLSCDLVGGVHELWIEWPGADGYDHEWVEQEAADAGCGPVQVVNGTAIAGPCDF